MTPSPVAAPAAISAPELIFTNARVVLADEVIEGSVMLRDGIIDSIDQGRSTAPGAIDLEGDMLCPGLVELHTDNLERHLSPRPGVDWPAPRAVVAHDAELASTGISTVFDALRVGSVPSDTRTGYGKYARGLCDEILRLQKRGVLRISHHLHLRAEVCSETLIEELDEFGPEDRVGLISLMDHTPGQRQFADIAQLRLYLSNKHTMSEPQIEAHFAHLRDLRARNGEAHEAHAVRRAFELGAVLASHDDTTADHVRTSAAHGIRLAEFPTTLAAARACREKSIAVIMGAPNLLRGKSHSGNVSALDMLDAGLLDILSSDYVPAALLAAAVKIGALTGDMARGIATVTDAPARAVGLNERGRIEPGMRGDLLRVRMEGDTPVPRSLHVRGVSVA